MDFISNNPLIIVTPEEIQIIRKTYGVDDIKRIGESVDIIEDWLKKQPHLAEAAQYVSRHLIERMLIISKGSVEMTKNRFDRMLTARGMMPEIISNRSLEEFDKLWEVVNYVPLPKLHPGDHSRVMVTQFLSEKLEPFNLLSYFRFSFLVGEYRINYDYTPAETFIIDFTNIHIGLLSKVNPVVVKKAEVLCSDGFGTKIKGIHIVNAPSFIDKVVSIIKQALREKVANRVHVHNSYEDLHKFIPKEILPKDYGGENESISKLTEQWKDLLKSNEAERWIKQVDKLVSNECKRQNNKFNEEYMGMPGSFRRLTVD